MWKAGPAPPLTARDVHVWRANLDLPHTSIQQLRALLSGDECERADRFYFERDRRRFVAARGTLRSLLGHYLKQPPENIQFSYEPRGKPYLQRIGHSPKLHFNVSHSSEMALIAFCMEHRVGIDIEFKNPAAASLDIARHFFAPDEVAVLAALPTEARSDAFFAIWSMKEAYIKARGEGVSLGLDTFAVSIDPERPRALIRSSHGSDEPGRWRFWAIDAGSAYAAAMAVEGAGERRLSLWDATVA